MKNALRSLALATVLSGFVAQAASAESATISNDAPKFVPLMEVSGRYVLLDSTRKTKFDFLSQTFRLGARYTQGAFSAVGQAQFLGNVYGQYPSSVDSGVVGGQTVGVRQAYVGYDVSHNEHNGNYNIKLGRFIPNGANMYGNDAATGWFNLSGFFPEDGIMVSYDNHFGASVDFTAQAVVANALPIALYRSPVPTTLSNIGTNVWEFDMSGSTVSFAGGSNYNGNGGGLYSNFTSPSNANSNNADKAYIVNSAANIGLKSGATLEVAAAVAMQNKDIYSAGSAIALSSTGLTVGAPATARDVKYAEASVGYNNDKMKAGGWLSVANLGQQMTMNDVNAGASQFVNGTGPTDNYVVAGLGAQADSRMMGRTGFVTKKDVLTAGVSTEVFAHRQSGSNAVSDSTASQNDVYMLSAGVGYKTLNETTANWYAEIDPSYMMATNNVFLNQGNNAYSNNAFLFHVVAGMSL